MKKNGTKIFKGEIEKIHMPNYSGATIYYELWFLPIRILYDLQYVDSGNYRLTRCSWLVWYIVHLKKIMVTIFRLKK